MKTSITLNKQDIEEIIAQRFGVNVNRVTLSISKEIKGYGPNEYEGQTIAGVVNLDNPEWTSQIYHVAIKDAGGIRK